MKIQLTKNGFKFLRLANSYTYSFESSIEVYHHHYYYYRTCSLVVRSKWNAADDICSDPRGTETLCILVTILHGTKPVCGLTPALLYCCASFFQEKRIIESTAI